MYKKIKFIGKLISYAICAITIDLIDLTDSYILNYIVISPCIVWSLRRISYFTCNKVVYQKLNIGDSETGSSVYWISFIVYILILYGILLVFKKHNIIPIITDLDMKIFWWIMKFINSIFINSIEDIINVFQI